MQYPRGLNWHQGLVPPCCRRGLGLLVDRAIFGVLERLVRERWGLLRD